MNDKERMNNFLAELTTLSKKYSVYIWGCGCCSSPSLDIEIDAPKGKYVHNKDRGAELAWEDDE